jgi:hypothetical protein
VFAKKDIVREFRSYKGDGSLILKETYTYDARTRSAEFIRSRGDGSVLSRSVSRFDAHGNPVELTVYAGDGLPTSREVSTYDQGGSLREFKKYGRRGDLILREASTYDAAGRLVEARRYSEGGSLVSKDVYVYSDPGNRQVSLYTVAAAELPKMADGRCGERRTHFGPQEPAALVVDVDADSGCEGKAVTLDVIHTPSGQVVHREPLVLREGYYWTAIARVSGSQEEPAMAPGTYQAILTWEGTNKRSCVFSVGE